MSRKPYPDDKPLGQPYRSAEDVPSLHDVVWAHFMDRIENPRPVTPAMREMVRKFGPYVLGKK